MLGPSFRLVPARAVIPLAAPGKRVLAGALALALPLAGCGGGAARKTQVVAGNGYRFHAPSGWQVKRSGPIVNVSSGESIVSVTTFRLAKPYRPALFRKVAPEIDGVASKLARQLGGTVASSRTESFLGSKVRVYRLAYRSRRGGKLGAEVTFLLRGKREYQLFCQSARASGDGGCALLRASFRPA
jgi:hypothetical protein